MLRKLSLTLLVFNLIMIQNSYSRPLLEYLGSVDRISTEDVVDKIPPLNIEPLIQSREELKEFLKKYGTLKLNVFKQELECDSTVDLVQNDEGFIGPPEKNVDSEVTEPPKLPELRDGIFSGVELPKSLGPELIILENSHLGEYIKFGLWSKNLKTWNIFRLNLYTYKNDSISTDVVIEKDHAKAEVKYQYRIGQRDTIELKFYNQLNHDILTPTNLQSGGQIQYKFRVGKFNFGFYFFGSHELEL